MATINSAYRKLASGYLFPEINRRVRSWQERNPDKKVLRLGIGNTTEALPQAICEAMIEKVWGRGRPTPATETSRVTDICERPWSNTTNRAASLWRWMKCSSATERKATLRTSRPSFRPIRSSLWPIRRTRSTSIPTWQAAARRGGMRAAECTGTLSTSPARKKTDSFRRFPPSMSI